MREEKEAALRNSAWVGVSWHYGISCLTLDTIESRLLSLSLPFLCSLLFIIFWISSLCAILLSLFIQWL